MPLATHLDIEGYITEPQDPATFPYPYAVTREEWVKAAYNNDHPAVYQPNPTYMFVQCMYCGKIVTKRRKQMRKNIKYCNIQRVFCNRNCSWAYYRNIDFEGKRHTPYKEMLHERYIRRKELRETRRNRMLRMWETGKLSKKSTSDNQ